MNEHGFKSEVAIGVPFGWLVYYSPADSTLLTTLLTGTSPVFLQTFDGHEVIVNPNLLSVVEVRDYESDEG